MKTLLNCKDSSSGSHEYIFWRANSTKVLATNSKESVCKIEQQIFHLRGLAAKILREPQS